MTVKEILDIISILPFEDRELISEFLSEDSSNKYLRAQSYGLLPGFCPDCGAKADWNQDGNLVCRNSCGWTMVIKD